MKESAIKFWAKVFGNTKEVMEWVHPVISALHKKCIGKNTDQEKEDFTASLEKYLHKK